MHPTPQSYHGRQPLRGDRRRPGPHRRYRGRERVSRPLRSRHVFILTTFPGFEHTGHRVIVLSRLAAIESGDLEMSSNSFDWAYTGIERPRRRRLSDKIISAFHAGCNEGALDIAADLLSVLQVLVKHPPRLPAGTDRRKPEDLAILRERLWSLRHPSPWSTNADSDR
jgi:hypothetical protein